MLYIKFYNTLKQLSYYERWRWLNFYQLKTFPPLASFIDIESINSLEARDLLKKLPHGCLAALEFFPRYLRNFSVNSPQLFLFVARFASINNFFSIFASAAVAED